MNMLKALRETIDLAIERNYDNIEFEEIGVDCEHFVSMYNRAQAGVSDRSFSDAKLGRWLGYVQGVMVANAVATLEEMKQINQRNAG